MLYINEAHPSNGWFIGDPIHIIGDHISINDRQSAADRIALPHIHTWLDDMDNTGQKFFGVKYERLYVIDKGVVVYQGGNGPFGYSLDDLDAFLQVMYALM